MPAANRKGKGGLAAKAKAAAANKLMPGSVDADVTPLPSTRTSPRRQPSTTSLLAATTPALFSLPSTNRPTNLSRGSTLNANSRSASVMSLSRDFDSSSEQEVNSDDGSIAARKKAVDSDSEDEDSDDGAKSDEVNNRAIQNEIIEPNNQEIEDAITFLGGDDNSLDGGSVGGNDYSAQDYDLFDALDDSLYCHQ